MRPISKVSWVVIGILLAIGLAVPLRYSQAQTAGFHVSGRNLLDSNNNDWTRVPAYTSGALVWGSAP